MAGTFTDEVTNALRNGYCSIVGSYANFLEQNFPAFGIVPNPGLGAARLAQRLFCNSEPPDEPPPIDPGFTGGQCVGVTYRVTCSITFPFGGSPVTVNPQRLVTGPITFVGTERVSSTSIRTIIRSSGGSVTTEVDSYSSSEENVDQYTLNSVSVIRPDGLPDNCGDPDPLPPPPPPPPPDGFNVIDVDVTYTDNSGNDITVPIVAVFAPVVIAGNGNVFAPVRVNVPVDADLNLNGTLNLTTGDINLNFGDQNRLPGLEDCPPAPPGLPDDIPDVPDDVPDYSEPDEPGVVPTVIRGAIVTVTETGNGVTHVFQGDNPDVYLPRLGNIQFQMEFGRRIAWSEDIPVKNRRQFIRCPWEGGAIAVEGTPAPGVVWEITPVYDFSDRVIEILPFVD